MTTAHDPIASARTTHLDNAPPTPLELAPYFPTLDIISLIGQGGMGAIYRVRYRHGDGFFALKIVRPGPGQEAEFAARFLREAEALERLDHPNIVAIRGHGREGPWFWLTMDLIEGATLREIVATGQLSPAQTLALVPPLCAALQYAHDKGVVHRDLKPENIILDGAGIPHVVDFGLAKLHDASLASGLTHTGATMGTVHYMAPEQVASAKHIDHRADIYALGVVIYELLTGQLPLGRFETPSQRVQVDVRIDEVVLKALERDPERRWQQMRMVGDAVTAMSEERKPQPDTQRGQPWPAWSRWTLAILAGLLVLAIPLNLVVRDAITGMWVSSCLVAMAVIALMHVRRPFRWLMAAVGVGIAIVALVFFVTQQQAQTLREQAEAEKHQAMQRERALLDQQRHAAVLPGKGAIRSADPGTDTVMFASDVIPAERQRIESLLNSDDLSLDFDDLDLPQALETMCARRQLHSECLDATLRKRKVTVHHSRGSLNSALRSVSAEVSCTYHYSAARPDVIQVIPASNILTPKPLPSHWARP